MGKSDRFNDLMGVANLWLSGVDEAGATADKSGYELRQERYRESNENKKARDLDRRRKRASKRSQAY